MGALGEALRGQKSMVGVGRQARDEISLEAKMHEQKDGDFRRFTPAVSPE
jgi:hypothetical protein